MQIDPETAKLLDALLPNTGFDGWTGTALRQALISLGRDPGEAKLLFAADTDMIEAYFALADQRMIEAATGLEGGLTARVRQIVTRRLEQMAGDKEAIRRAISRLTLPTQAPRLARIIAASADSIWFAAGDTSADFSWYTKRFSLGSIWLATLLFWLSDDSAESEATLTFIDRRLQGVGRIGKFRRQTQERVRDLLPFRFANRAENKAPEAPPSGVPTQDTDGATREKDFAAKLSASRAAIERWNTERAGRLGSTLGALLPDEFALMRLYHACSPERRRNLLQTARDFAGQL